MGEKLELDCIQGNIVPGFNKAHQAFVLIQFANGKAGRRWVGQLFHNRISDITSSEEVELFRHIHRLAAHRRRGEESSLISSTWLNVAFSANGLRVLLESPPGGLFKSQFREERFLANKFAPRRSHDPEQDVHAVLIVAADRAGDLQSELDRQESRLEKGSVRLIATLRGNRLEEAREHFGFRDGLSQPTVDYLNQNSPSHAVKSSEFILGYTDETREGDAREIALTRNGSYLVFLKLRQDVPAFREALRTQSRKAGFEVEHLGAAIVGRWPDGERLGEPFARFSHVGRAHPSPNVVYPDDPEQHRLIRRGIPYGPPVDADHKDGHDRGLLFLGYQANIAKQFEHVWSSWLDNANFPVAGAGGDPLTGSAEKQDEIRNVLLPRGDEKGGITTLGLQQFVSLEYGGYFFAPSIPALARLAGEANVLPDAPTTTDSPPPKGVQNTIYLRESKETNVADWQSDGIRLPRNNPGDGHGNYRELFLFESPYDIGQDATEHDDVELDGPAANFRSGRRYSNSFKDFIANYPATSEDPDKDLLHWRFKGKDQRISKALRVTYDYTDPRDRTKKTGWVLIGFVGPIWP